jgi:Protein of unknown function (DUF3489)
MNFNFKFTPTQRNVLSVSAQREDRCIELSPGLRGSAARVFAAKLIDAGLAREMRTKDGLPVWRRDQDTSRDYSLKLTALGIRIVAEEQRSVERPANNSPKPASPSPRESSKLSQVMLMLSQESGVTVQEISKAMGCFAHTTRATLTGLRKRGVHIIRLTREGERSSSYRIEPYPETRQAA